MSSFEYEFEDDLEVRDLKPEEKDEILNQLLILMGRKIRRIKLEGTSSVELYTGR